MRLLVRSPSTRTPCSGHVNGAERCAPSLGARLRGSECCRLTPRALARVQRCAKIAPRAERAKRSSLSVEEDLRSRKTRGRTVALPQVECDRVECANVIESNVIDQ